MTAEETKEIIEQQKAQGASEEDIAGKFYLMFCEEKITVDELDNLLGFLGMELTDDFKAMSPEDQMTKGFEMADADKNGETAEEEAKPSQEEEKSDDNSDNSDEEDDSDAEEDEDEESKAMRLMGLKK